MKRQQCGRRYSILRARTRVPLTSGCIQRLDSGVLGGPRSPLDVNDPFSLSGKHSEPSWHINCHCDMENHTSKPLLILDLDETLIFGSERPLQRDADFRVGPFYLYKRPFLDQFLASASKLYDVAIWSSASEDYVDGIGRYLLPIVGEWKFVWSRGRCIQRLNPEIFETDFIKDLRKVRRIGFDLDRTLIVDDTSRKVCRNYGNAI
ncbi:NIF family HAD-type phosphatase [Pirellulaceae bacterium SH449]